MSKLPVWSKAKLGTKLSIIAFVPFLLTSVCILAALSVLSDAYADARREQEARQIIGDCETTMDSLIMCGSLLGFYLRNRDPKVLAQFYQTAGQIDDRVKRLEESTGDEPGQLKNMIAEFSASTQQMNGFTRLSVDQWVMKRHKDSLLDVMNFRAQAVKYATQEKVMIDHLERYVNTSMANRPVKHSPFYWFLRNNISLAVGLSIFGSLSLALLLSRSIVSRLRLLTQKAMRLALLEAPEIPERGNDEIAQVDHVFNDMAFQLLNAIKRQQAAIACAADAIISLDADGKVRSANEALSKSWGFQPHELTGKPVFPFIAEPDRAKIKEALSSQHGLQFEASISTADHRQLACLWSTSFSPGEQATIAIVHDVSERKAEEEKLAANEARTRMLMERMPAGLVLISASGAVSFANETACRLLKRSASELSGRQFTSLLAGSGLESPQAFPELLSRRAQSYITGIKGDDEVRLQLGISKFGKQEGVDLYLVVVVDYTQRFRFEELKQRLVAMIAHDIATPLMTVQNTLSMASSGMFGGMKTELEQDVDQAEKESAKILQVFKNVVRFQKLASGFSSMSAARLPLSEMTGQALDVVAQPAEEKSLKLNNQVQSDAAALGDADKLAVLAATLLQTVVEAAGSNAKITIDSSQEPGFVLWLLSVEDSQKPPERSRAYWSEMDVFASADQELPNDLDLILWRLLLYQCGAKVAYSQSEQGYSIGLRMPSLNYREMPAA